METYAVSIYFRLRIQQVFSKNIVLHSKRRIRIEEHSENPPQRPGCRILVIGLFYLFEINIYLYIYFYDLFINFWVPSLPAGWAFIGESRDIFSMIRARSFPAIVNEVSIANRRTDIRFSVSAGRHFALEQITKWMIISIVPRWFINGDRAKGQHQLLRLNLRDLLRDVRGRLNFLFCLLVT